MASVEEVKAGLSAASSEASGTVAQARAAKESADKMITRLRAVAQGTSHPKIQEAIAKAEQAKQKLDEAAALANAAAESARAYMAVLG